MRQNSAAEYEVHLHPKRMTCIWKIDTRSISSCNTLRPLPVNQIKPRERFYKPRYCPLGRGAENGKGLGTQESQYPRHGRCQTAATHSGSDAGNGNWNATGWLCRRAIENQIVYGTNPQHRGPQVQVPHSAGQQQRAAQRNIKQGMLTRERCVSGVIVCQIL